MKRTIIILLATYILAAFAGCEDSNNDIGSYKVRSYFVNPSGAEKVQDEILEIIEGSEKTLDICCYLCEDQTLATAVINAKNRGVRVRVIGDDENIDNYDAQYDRLEDAGIEIVTDDNSNSMHNKSLVADSMIVIGGCTNWTYSGLFSNNNSIVIVESREIALGYLEDFQQMWGGRFHTSKSSNGYETATLEGTTVECRFSPQDNTEDLLRNAVQNADESVEIAIYALTLNYLTNDIIAAHNRGVDVKVIMDSLIVKGDEPWSSPAKYNELRSAGVDVRLDPCPYAFHHKFTIIDRNATDKEVIVSSANYSMGGTNYGSENFLHFTGGDIVDQYKQEFDRWWADARVEISFDSPTGSRQ